MAAPATPSRTLPKSNFQKNITSAPSDSVTSAATPVGDAAPQQLSGFAIRGYEDSTLPDHHVSPPSYEGVENLVIVCCHAIFHPDASSPSFPLHSPHHESNWHLAPFQKSNPETGKPGEHETFMAHVTAGVDALTSGASTESTLLVLSGGATKRSLTSLSEARSYYHAALAHELAEGNQGGGRAHELFTKGRILLEENATDSFQNLLFGILLFRRATGSYPKQIRIITHAFKAKRFLELHAPTIKWPPVHVQVQGIDPVMSSGEFEETIKGEEKYGYTPWLGDPLGTGELLGRKRQQRGWNEEAAEEVGEGLEESIKELLSGKTPDTLPWNQPHSSTGDGTDPVPTG